MPFSDKVCHTKESKSGPTRINGGWRDTLIQNISSSHQREHCLQVPLGIGAIVYVQYQRALFAWVTHLVGQKYKSWEYPRT